MAIVNLPDTLEPERRARVRAALARVLARQILDEWWADADVERTTAPVENHARQTA